MNLTQAGLSTSFSLDATNRQLSNAAVSNVSFDPTSKARVSAHETDRQAEDNATWYFEYRALLNSKLTTLITSLTSAYTTDLDASMSSKDPNGSNKSSMQGLTGYVPPISATYPSGTRPFVDPGAVRTSVSYLSGFGSKTINNNITTPFLKTPSGNWAGDDTNISDPSASFSVGFDSNDIIVNKTTGLLQNVTVSTSAQAPDPAVPIPTLVGTTTFLSGGSSTFLLDNLYVNLDPYNSAPDVSGTKVKGFGANLGNYNYYDNEKDIDRELSSYERSASDTTDKVKNSRNIGNNFEFTLYKFFERPENLDLIRFGFFKDVYVVGTSSLPTGSQVQGSLSLDWSQTTGVIKIKQERYAAFFHS